MLKFIWRGDSRVARRTEAPIQRSILHRPRLATVESLEARRLFALAQPALAPISGSLVGDGITPSATQPSIRAMVTPMSGQQLSRDGFISASINLVSPGNGVDAATLSTDTVKLWKI